MEVASWWFQWRDSCDWRRDIDDWRSDDGGWWFSWKRRLAVDLTHHLDYYISQYNYYSNYN